MAGRGKADRVYIAVVVVLSISLMAMFVALLAKSFISSPREVTSVTASASRQEQQSQLKRLLEKRVKGYRCSRLADPFGAQCEELLGRAGFTPDQRTIGNYMQHIVPKQLDSAYAIYGWQVDLETYHDNSILIAYTWKYKQDQDTTGYYFEYSFGAGIVRCINYNDALKAKHWGD